MIRLSVAMSVVMLLGLTYPVFSQTRIPTTPGARFRDCPECPEMVVVPAGAFLMGTSPSEAARDEAAVNSWFDRWLVGGKLSAEQPKHEVTIAQPFALGRYPVTRGEFSAFVQATGYAASRGCDLRDRSGYRLHADASWLNPGFIQSDRDPVVCINVEDATAYVGWLNRVAGHDTSMKAGKYRLPSEAEWEYAARAGTRTTRWWGDDIGVGNANCTGCGLVGGGQRTVPVDLFPGSKFGISGSLGNAWQWTDDCWNTSYVSAPADGKSWTGGDCSERVFRGGAATTDYRLVRSASRSHYPKNDRAVFVGFRVARDLP